MTLSNLLTLSRPRFWIYTVGPYLVALAAVRELPTLPVVLLGLYLTFPANLLIYGVNDIYDTETDRLNAKKGSYEALLQPAVIKSLVSAIVITNVPSIVLFFLLPASASLWLVLFLITGIGYSANPVRAKTKPLLDTIFNILYVAPAFAAYVTLSDRPVAVPIVIAATVWCMAMHAYSAVPDISADKASGTPTIATWLGPRRTLAFCAVAYSMSAVLAYHYVGLYALAAGMVYLGLIAVSWRAGTEKALFTWYRRFPLVNTVLGAGLFFAVAFAG